jgi:hypothetical protein
MEWTSLPLTLGTKHPRIRPQKVFRGPFNFRWSEHHSDSEKHSIKAFLSNAIPLYTVSSSYSWLYLRFSNCHKMCLLLNPPNPRLSLTPVNCCNCLHNRMHHHHNLTPKGRSPVFGPFLKFGQDIMDAIFVQKI